MYKCEMCGIEFEAKKAARTCSPRCRKLLSRQESVTPNVTLSDPTVTDNFEFTVPQNTNKKRTAAYWYDVPISALPVLQKDWPAMPSYMNGRQYFLWWKNGFKVEGEVPVIHNPFPSYNKLEYVNAREGSRRWGA